MKKILKISGITIAAIFLILYIFPFLFKDKIQKEVKILANKKDVPYQSLAKVFLARQIVLERESLSRSSRKPRVKAASRSK